MTCLRCHGCMVRERFTDLWDDTGQIAFPGWRCLNCGDVLDGVVLRHRADREQSPYRSSRRWVRRTAKERRNPVAATDAA